MQSLIRWTNQGTRNQHNVFTQFFSTEDLQPFEIELKKKQTSGQPTAPTSPQTGDSLNVKYAAGIAALGAMLLAAGFLLGKKKKKNKETAEEDKSGPSEKKDGPDPEAERTDDKKEG